MDQTERRTTTTTTTRAQFLLLVNARKLDLPLDVQCSMFDKTVVPVLLYGGEVWGSSSINMLEALYRQYLNKCKTKTLHRELYDIR